MHSLQQYDSSFSTRPRIYLAPPPRQRRARGCALAERSLQSFTTGNRNCGRQIILRQTKLVVTVQLHYSWPNRRAKVYLTFKINTIYTSMTLTCLYFLKNDRCRPLVVILFPVLRASMWDQGESCVRVYFRCMGLVFSCDRSTRAGTSYTAYRLPITHTHAQWVTPLWINNDVST